MIGLLKSGWAFVTGKRDYLTLLAVAAAAAWLYAQWAGAQRERDNVVATADQICAAAGSRFEPGAVQCRAAVTRLSAFERATSQQTTAPLARKSDVSGKSE